MSEPRDHHNPFGNGRGMMAEHSDELLTIAFLKGSAIVQYTGSDNGAYMMTTLLLDHPLSRLHDMFGAQDFSMVITPRDGFPGYDEDEEVGDPG